MLVPFSVKVGCYIPMRADNEKIFLLFYRDKYTDISLCLCFGFEGGKKVVYTCWCFK